MEYIYCIPPVPVPEWKKVMTEMHHISHESKPLKCLYASSLLQTDVTYDLICLHSKTLSLQQR